MRNDPSNSLGGDIQKNLEGEYVFSLQKILKEAWQLTLRDLWSFLAAFIVVLALGVVLLLAGIQLTGATEITQLTPNQQVVINLVVTVIMAPFFTALLAMAVNNSVGGKSRIGHLVSFVPKALVLALTAILITAIVNIGMVFFVLPGLYLIIATGFALLLVAEKRLAPFAAIALSIKMVNAYWWDFIRLYLFFALLCVTIVFTSGLSLIIIGPLYYHTKGLLYRDLFGITVITRIDPTEEDRDDTFFNA